MFCCCFAGLLIGFAPGANAKVKVSEERTYFPISGKNGEALNASMLIGGKNRIDLAQAVAATETEYNLGEPEFTEKNGRCRVKGIDVHLSIRYIFPQWKNRKSAPKQVQEKWEIFWRELERHELHHGEIARNAAEKLQKQLDLMVRKNQVDCDSFEQLASSKLDAAVRLASIEQLRFDRREYTAFSKISRTQTSLYKAR